jgi:hypothetical protein
MNKKLFVGTALTVAVVGGYVYYRYAQTHDVNKEIRERAMKLFADDEAVDLHTYEDLEP